ncbi:MAG: sigma-70 family RNA polymerase sigma factor [Acidobacteria bacterium]|nr:sigma-70 family RNA polymerase sigma factor [Acidobacteriota bacterium]NIM63261.1 sigma-70 family RNA polymerase sigma factor [Acidobacteriota bacterium]NIO60054.1 sigma-70 family RNA polymerase sigma factor [Acidobacteriota bacterium]NIQ31125.1 sigma-70 family RNA polymerase sigma factor [Acidobacteriota bacterium]NIQ86234.1 sigma-70 family RNA polymerase sigma factor [Acidobacteriota bacterium]
MLRDQARAPDEATLAARFRAGDRNAFDEIVTLHRGSLYSVARRLLRRHEDADEAAQTAFVRAWRARERFRGDAQLRTWLMRIVLNVSKSMLASRRIEQELPADSGWAVATQTDPGARIDEVRRQHELRRAVDGLPPRQREVVMLKVYEDLTHREVAEILELSEGAVKAHLHQAVSNLRRGLMSGRQMEKA